MERTLYLWRSSEKRAAVDLRLVVLADFINLGGHWTAAKPPEWEDFSPLGRILQT